MAQQVIAVIGAGGKTTALGLLAKQSSLASVLVTTTTHIFPTTEFPCIENPAPEDFVHKGILWAGTSAKEGKLGMLPEQLLDIGLRTSDLVIYEGDGSRQHPLKLHRPGEPVILPETTHCLILAGLSALGQAAEDAIHCCFLHPSWEPEQIVNQEALVHCVAETAAASRLPFHKIKVFLNQADTLDDPAPAMNAAQILRAMGLDTRYGSLQECPDDLYSWVTEGRCP